MASSEIRSASGASCEQSDFQPWEITSGIGQDDRKYYDRYDDYANSGDDTGTYFGLTVSYSFGGAKPIDCGKFQSKVERQEEAYTKQLEIKVQQLQAQLAKEKAVNTQRVKFK
ncbi:hypothetical protein JCM19239_1565 [Vibrio variabilis]|uniref:Uncharacterized protein n=1 Tax=Vibrio variabilis TaxID=990271 RepID=A0ABQ0JIA2_9VIBR|nr:hypothetical protein JCM19239_1565 [Vibrio variabilis]